jgi:hypothetical protein
LQRGRRCRHAPASSQQPNGVRSKRPHIC